MAFRWLQDGPKMASRWPKMAPRWPKMAQDGPKKAPRWPQEGSKMAQDGPKTVQDEPKKALRWPKMAPREGLGPTKPLTQIFADFRSLLGPECMKTYRFLYVSEIPILPEESECFGRLWEDNGP